MNTFKLDTRLEEDCLTIGEIPSGLLLMMNNQEVPWFIIVPPSDVIEFTDLDDDQQYAVLRDVKRIANVLQKECSVDKVNIAMIGNIVSQLHIHVVGRYKDDYCWPRVVWGAAGAEKYQLEESQHIIQKVKDLLDIS